MESDLIDGGTQRLLRIFGCGHAMRLVEVGCGIDAMRALAAGFAQALVPGGHVLERALQIAQQSGDLPQTAPVADCLSLVAGTERSFEAGAESEAEVGRAVKGDPDVVRRVGEYRARREN